MGPNQQDVQFVDAVDGDRVGEGDWKADSS